MSPIIPVLLITAAAILGALAVFADFRERPDGAVIAGLLAVVAFALMLIILPDVSWGSVPEYDPETCADLARLDGRWTCIPREEIG